MRFADRALSRGWLCVAAAFSVGLAASPVVAQVGFDEPPVEADAIGDGREVEGGRIVDDTGRVIEPSGGQVRRRQASRMSSLVVRYSDSQAFRPGFPSIEDVAKLEIMLAVRRGLILAPEEASAGTETFTTSLSEVGSHGTAISRKAMEAMGLVIRDWLYEGGLVAKVAPAIPPGADARALDLAVEVLIDVGTYPVGSLSAAYLEEHPAHPTMAELFETEVELSRAPEGWVAADDRFVTRRIALSDLTNLETNEFYASALLAINVALRDALLQRGLIGVLVVTDPEAINLRTLTDERSPDDDSLKLVIFTGVVREVRTLAFGGRIGDNERENNPMHRRIVENSPLQVWDNQSERHDLLRRDELDEFLLRLNRFTGRRVDAAISPAEDRGAQLDFLVSERQQTLGYVQVANTGTKSTDEIRYRAGLNITQLANMDDVLTLDYITAGFDASKAVISTYEARVPGTERLRWKLDGNFSEFTASDVGLAGESFEGESYAVGGELIYNFYQHRDFFVDAFVGARFQHVKVENVGLGLTGESDFMIPRVGVRFERDRKAVTTYGAVWVEGNLPDLGGTEDKNQLATLGRLFVDEDWFVAKWNLSHSFYLEPLVNRANWVDLQTPSSSTLAHEIALGIRGQYSPDHRLIPQEQQVAGGLYTVRGYPESVAAGDSVYIASAEYRFHLPKSYGYSDDTGTLFGSPFRWRPQEPFGEADWDLVFKGFVDAGRTENTERLAFEFNETLIGAGVGVDFTFRRRFTARMDWGFAMRDTENGTAEAGDNELHFSFTALF
ncbi:MAG: hemolysin activation/secretion protein [Phycisphaerales bacterium]|jgi:hemolysin activation/secretion protein